MTTNVQTPASGTNAENAADRRSCLCVHGAGNAVDQSAPLIRKVLTVLLASLGIVMNLSCLAWAWSMFERSFLGDARDQAQWQFAMFLFGPALVIGAVGSCLCVAALAIAVNQRVRLWLGLAACLPAVWLLLLFVSVTHLRSLTR
jgi:hypothetical protein